MSNFSQRLNEAIMLRGVSQKWLADEAKTTEATISRYINGKASPSILITIKDIAEALHVSSDYLLGLTNIPTSKENVSTEERAILSVWAKVSADDKKVFFALLDKYLSDDERKTLKGE